MSPFYKTEQPWAYKIALFGLFVAGLLIASFMVASRSGIKFSGPIELDYLGVSVSVPSGNGWESDKQWRYEESDFIISSFFSVGSVKPTAAFHCRYLLAPADANCDARIERKARRIGGTIAEKGALAGSAAVFTWATMKIPATKTQGGFDTLFGTAQLANGRAVTVEVRWSEEDDEMAKEIFSQAISTFEFKGSPLQELGIEVMGKMKAEGLSRLLTQRNKQSYFVIKDTAGQPVGFAIDILADLGGRTAMNIQAASSIYIRGRGGREEITLFQGSEHLSEFIWKSEFAGRFGRSGSEAVFDRTGTLSVKNYGTVIIGRKPEEGGVQPFEERFYKPGLAAIPDVLGDLIYSAMLNSKYGKILIDTLRPDGAIVPVIISHARNDKTGPDKEAAYALRLDFMDGRNSYAQVYFDSARQIYKEVIMQQGGQYMLEQSSPEELRTLFPEKGGNILQPVQQQGKAS